MTNFILVLMLIGWIASAITRNEDKKKNDKRYNKVRKVQKKQATRIDSLEAAQKKQEEINRKQAEKNAKLEAQIRKAQFSAQQAQKEIDAIMHQMESKREYGEYLELERDGCVKGSKYYHKWNNKVMANDNQLRNLEKQLDKAMFARNEARIKMIEVA